MNQTTENKAAPIPQPASTGNGKADHVSPIVNKNVSGTSWRRIGRLERVGEGARITISDKTVYLTRREALKITADRMPGDLVTIEETPGEIITSVIGKAFRSRTGRALMIMTPYLSCDGMVPYASFLKVMEGTQPAPPVSIVENTTSTRNPQQERVASLSHTSPGCF